MIEFKQGNPKSTGGDKVMIDPYKCDTCGETLVCHAETGKLFLTREDALKHFDYAVEGNSICSKGHKCERVVGIVKKKIEVE
jgi:myo-inositol-hexaphosphate 3-phosphohydrolase